MVPKPITNIDQDDDMNSGSHECFCNYCGDDITNKAN